MKNTNQNIKDTKIIQRYFFVFFILHFLLAHIAFANYLICIENDGGFSIENSVDSQFCCNPSIITQNNYGETEIKDDLECKLCKDISIYENCDEQYSNSIKKLTTIVYNSPLVESEAFGNIETEINFLDKDLQNKKTPQLDSYRTVLLLI